MINNDIILHLVERYLHGFTLDDPKYNKIINYLTNIMETSQISCELETNLKKHIGIYNQITEDLYITLATQYLVKNKQNPTISNVLLLI